MRTFIAIELDDPIRRKLGHIRQGTAIRDRAVRWVKPSSIHLTLKFLGEIEPEVVPEVSAAMERAVAGIAPFAIEVGEFGCFPNMHNPRVLWVGVRSPADTLILLQSEVEAELGAIGFKREKRAYKPHLTVARVRGRIGPLSPDDFGLSGDCAKPEGIIGL